MVENLHKHGSVRVSWRTQPVALDTNPSSTDDPEAYPNTIIVHNAEAGAQETIRAKYVVGGDGAHSWLRKYLKIGFSGDLTDSTWGKQP